MWTQSNWFFVSNLVDFCISNLQFCGRSLDGSQVHGVPTANDTSYRNAYSFCGDVGSEIATQSNFKIDRWYPTI